MERQQSDLIPVKAFLETVLPGHSAILKTTTRKCPGCQADYQATIAVKEGKELVINTECPSCAARARIAQFTTEQEAYRQQRLTECREYWRANCGPQGRFGGKAFGNFKRELQPKAFDAVKNYGGRSLVLYSPDLYGVGKTHLVSALANHLIDSCQTVNECPVYMTTEAQMLARIRATFNHKEAEISITEEMVYRSLESPLLLVLDDVGKVRPHDYSFTQQVYFRLVDGRYISGKPIILTTNLSLDELEQHIGGACGDRLREMCGKAGFIKMVGKSYRH